MLIFIIVILIGLLIIFITGIIVAEDSLRLQTESVMREKEEVPAAQEFRHRQPVRDPSDNQRRQL